MATLSQARMLGGIGAILIFIPFVSLVGYILIIVAVRDISNDLQDKSIFNNVIIGAATGIVGALAGALVVFAVIGAGSAVGLTGVIGVGAGLLIAWIALITSAVFLRRAYNTMGQRLGVGTFRTAATLYLVGAALTIVLVGFIILFIAEILQAVAYFSIPDQPATQTMQGAGVPPGPAAAAPPPSMAGQGGATKFCTSCGTRISPSATFCYSCGAKQS